MDRFVASSDHLYYLYVIQPAIVMRLRSVEKCGKVKDMQYWKKMNMKFWNFEFERRKKYSKCQKGCFTSVWVLVPKEAIQLRIRNLEFWKKVWYKTQGVYL